MYPKNAASPERVAIGAVVQISDGAVQTSGCTVRIIPAGGAEGDGAGTTAYSTDGVVLYTPTQAETNYSSFILIAKKTGCIPAAVTVVPTLSATAGQAIVPDTQKVDLNTIKTQGVTCGASVTVRADVGTAAQSTAQTGDGYAILNNGTYGNSALNTLLGTIAGYVDTEVATLVSEMAKVPKSDSNVSWNTTALAAIAAAILDLADGIETGITPRQAERLILAALCGKLSGAATTTVTIRNAIDSKNRIVATVDADGNRTAVTLTGT
jgi:hypothetical protein